MSTQAYIEAMYENVDIDHIPIYMTLLTCVGWLGYLTLELIPEAQSTLLPEAGTALMIVLMVAPFIQGISAVIREWRESA